MHLEFLDEKTQENQQFAQDEYDFQSKEKEMKEKIMLVTIKMEKNQKNDEVSQCMKEGTCRALKLIKNGVDQC